MSRFCLLSYLLSISTFLLIDSGFALESESILGGDLARIGFHTFNVIVETNGESYCSGNVLDEWIIITVAHCVMDNDFNYARTLKIIAGVNDLNKHDKYRVEVSVAKVYVPLDFIFNWKTDFIGDIAVLRLAQPLKYRLHPRISAIKLPNNNLANYAGEMAIISGFGWNEIRFAEPWYGTAESIFGSTSWKLHSIGTTVASNDTCQQKYPNYNYMWHLCARVLPRDPLKPAGVCRGDSGGPLVHKMKYLIGLQSFGPIHCHESDYEFSVYTRVSEHLDFIDKTRRDDCSDMNIVCHSMI